MVERRSTKKIAHPGKAGPISWRRGVSWLNWPHWLCFISAASVPTAPLSRIVSAVFHNFWCSWCFWCPRFSSSSRSLLPLEPNCHRLSWVHVFCCLSSTRASMGPTGTYFYSRDRDFGTRLGGDQKRQVLRCSALKFSTFSFPYLLPSHQFFVNFCQMHIKYFFSSLIFAVSRLPTLTARAVSPVETTTRRKEE